MDHEITPRMKEDHILDLNIAACRWLGHPTGKEVFDSLKTQLGLILIKCLQELSKIEQETYDVAIEMAGSVYLLELLGSWNSTFETHGKKAGRGVMLVQDGARLVAEGQELFQSAIIDMSASTTATSTAM